jgi:hypothetical protein
VGGAQFGTVPGRAGHRSDQVPTAGHGPVGVGIAGCAERGRFLAGLRNVPSLTARSPPSAVMASRAHCAAMTWAEFTGILTRSPTHARPRSQVTNTAKPQVTGSGPVARGLARTDERPAKRERTALTNGPLAGATLGGKA